MAQRKAEAFDDATYAEALADNVEFDLAAQGLISVTMPRETTFTVYPKTASLRKVYTLDLGDLFADLGDGVGDFVAHLVMHGAQIKCQRSNAADSTDTQRPHDTALAICAGDIGGAGESGPTWITELRKGVVAALRKNGETAKAASAAAKVIKSREDLFATYNETSATRLANDADESMQRYADLGGLDMSAPPTETPPTE